MIKPYYLGENNLVEQCQKINIDDIVRQVNKEVKCQVLQSQIEVMGLKLNLLTSRTRFNGKRYWFSCPTCNNRIGTIYRHPISLQVGCRNCLGIQYRKQRFKGMIEGSNLIK